MRSTLDRCEPARTYGEAMSKSPSIGMHRLIVRVAGAATISATVSCASALAASHARTSIFACRDGIYDLTEAGARGR
jgi:hypothetical protein